MAGKEAVVFLVDCTRSMADHMEEAREAVRVIIVQKMLQTKQNELGIIMFGLPPEETSNALNDADEEDYLGVKELHRVEQGSVPMLKILDQLEVTGTPDGERHGDLLDAMVVGVDAIKRRTSNKKFARHVYLLTDAAGRVDEVEHLPEVVAMYKSTALQCKLHYIGFGPVEPVTFIKREVETDAKDSSNTSARDDVKAQNEKMLASVAAATGGTVSLASTVINVMGEAMIKTVNPMLSKVDIKIGTKLAIHCRWFKKTDASLKAHLMKEVIDSSEAGGDSRSRGKVRMDRTYRDPDMPEVEVDFVDQVKGYRYGEDYIPVGVIDADILKLPEETPSIKVHGFTARENVPRHFFMEDTYVVLPEPASAQATSAMASLVQAMNTSKQVALVRFVRRKGSDPWMGVLIPDTTGVSRTDRFLFQKLPFSEDLRDYLFPSFAKAPPRRTPSEEQKKISLALVEAMTVLDEPGDRGIRAGLVLNPVKQAVDRAKVARAMDPDCELPELPPYLKASMTPDPAVVDKAATVLQDYAKAFVFEKQEQGKGTKRKVTYFSDLALADTDTSETTSPALDVSGKNLSTGFDNPADDLKRSSRNAAGHQEGVQTELSSRTARLKVGSINPAADFAKMMEVAREADEDGPDLAQRAVSEMCAIINTLVKKGTTVSQRVKAVNCVATLRKGCLAHFMGAKFNDFLRLMKERHQGGVHSDFWEMVIKDRNTWPITKEDDHSLTMTQQAARALMQEHEGGHEEEEKEVDDGEDDDDLDDMA